MKYTLFAMFLWILSAAADSDGASEDQLIKQLNEWELQSYKFKNQYQPLIEQAFQKMDRQETPRAWLHAYTLAEEVPDSDGFFKAIDGAMQQAKDWQDLALLYRLVEWKVSHLKDQTAPAEAFIEAFRQAESWCPESSHSVWCGRLYDQWAYYYYDTNDKAASIQQSQKSIAILQRVEGPEVFYLHDAQTTLSNVFAVNVQTIDQAIQLAEANYEWYAQNEYHSMAASEATNMTVYLSDRNPDNYVNDALQWLDKAEAHTKLSGRSMGFIYYSRSKILFNTGQYLETIKYVEMAKELYLQIKSLEFAALCEIRKARSLIKLKRPLEANAALDRAEKIVPATYRYQHLMILEVRIESAEAQGNFEQAIRMHKDYHKKWRLLKDEDAKKDITRLNGELGLKFEQERGARLKQEAESFRRFVIVLSLLSVSTLGFLLFALRQTQNVKQSHKKMQRILDNIDQGLLTFGRKRRINDGYSRKLPEILDAKQSLVGQDIMQAIFAPSQLPGEEQSMIHEILEATFHEDRLAWDLNAENLTREIRYDKKTEQIVELRWIPIFDKHDKLERLLLSLTDITEKKALEKAFGQQKRYLQALPDTLKEMLVGQPQHIARLLETTQEVLLSMQDAAIDSTLLRALHTQKGTARALGLRALSQDLHDLETSVQPKTGQAIGHSLNDQLKAIQDRLGEYRAIAEVLKTNQAVASSRRASLAHRLEAHVPSWLEHMEKAGHVLHRIALDDGVLRWQTGQLELLEQICVHAVNNSLDHGFLYSESRIHAPEIEIVATAHSGMITVEIRDNGQGLNMEQLNHLAIARGFVPKGNETIADVVFCDGFSLAKRVSLSSGRGVGLSAVKELVEKQGGEVHLLNRSTVQGSVLRATWPLAEKSRQAG